MYPINIIEYGKIMFVVLLIPLTYTETGVKLLWEANWQFRKF
jgi:hypothetical protein